MKPHIQQKLLLLIVSALSLFIFSPAKASHIVGGEVTYIYQGDTMIGLDTCHIYQITLAIYVDCLNGQPEAIAQDDPAFLALYSNTLPYALINSDSVHFSSSVTIPALTVPSPCGSIPTPFPTCLIKKTIVKTYYLHPNTAGYVFAYQRCCRNAEIVNIADPGDNGATYSCTIPASPVVNNSAVFKSYPPQIICYNIPLWYDNSATDADGDSLSYGFSTATLGANSSNIKPFPPLPPPYDSVSYISPYSAQIPFTGSPSITIDPVSGIITGIPNLKGRYLVTVSCYEWRGGVIINTMTREYQFIVNDCSALEYQPLAGSDTTVYVGDSVQFNASGGHDYSWTPGTYLNDPTIGNPIGHFTASGHFVYTLHALSDSGCSGTSTRTVSVLNHSDFEAPNAFTPNGDNINDYLKPIPLLNATLLRFRVFNRGGNIVYDGGPNDPGWDGTYKGKKQALGVYFWEITYKDNHGATRTAKGNSTLIR